MKDVAYPQNCALNGPSLNRNLSYGLIRLCVKLVGSS